MLERLTNYHTYLLVLVKINTYMQILQSRIIRLNRYWKTELIKLLENLKKWI